MIKPEEQFALLQCPQCDGWFIDSSDRDGEACPLCFEGYTPPETEGGSSEWKQESHHARNS